MRRTLVVSGASLGLHIWLFSLVAGYRELVFRVGSLFPHHHDVADILVVGGAGFAVLAVAMVERARNDLNGAGKTPIDVGFPGAV